MSQDMATYSSLALREWKSTLDDLKEERQSIVVGGEALSLSQIVAISR